MTTKNKVGDRTEPCCTLRSMGIDVDVVGPVLTAAERLLY